MPEAIATLAEESSLAAGGRVFSDALRVSILPARTVLLLQLGTEAREAAASLRVAGRPMPLLPNSWSGDDPVFARIAPDAWLIQSALHGAAELAEAVRSGCGRRAAAVTDLTDAHVTIAIDGADASVLLARGCGLNFAIEAFGLSSCARTRLAQLPVVLRRIGSERFECLVDRSVAQWLHDWLHDAAVGLSP
jgi:heterotetrameric sarcosine oxidase gamma subunit